MSNNNRNFVPNFNDIHFQEEYNQYESLGDFKEDYETTEETKVIFFNTKDINYLSEDTTYNFSIHFSPGNNDLSSINRTFKNVTNISFVDFVIRDAYVDLSHVNYLYNKGILTLSNCIRMERLSDLPYLILEITDINNINYGTNNSINKSSFILKYDDDKDIRNNSGTFITYAEDDNLQYKNVNNSVLPETNNKMMYYKCFSETPMNFYPSPKGTLKNMKICIKTPQGKIIQKMNNYLNLSSIERTGTGLFDIVMTEYFSPEEYSLGDRVVLKNVSITGTLQRKSDLETYLNNSEGMIILGHGNNLASTKMYKSLRVSFKNDLLKYASISTASSTYIDDNFGIPETPINCTGTVINTSQQILIGLEITSEVRDNNMLHSNIV
jgi:hypothetical protein